MEESETFAVEWVKVTERFPEDNDAVLVYLEGEYPEMPGCYGISFWNPGKGWDNVPDYLEVVGWAPFNEYPEHKSGDYPQEKPFVDEEVDKKSILEQPGKSGWFKWFSPE